MIARFQVVEVQFGWAVKDTRDDTFWTRTYARRGWAIRKAVRLEEAHGKRGQGTV